MISFLEIFIVHIIVLVQLVQILSQLLGALELVHMDEGVVGSHGLVLLQPGAHHDRDNSMTGGRGSG